MWSLHKGVLVERRLRIASPVLTRGKIVVNEGFLELTEPEQFTPVWNMGQLASDFAKAWDDEAAAGFAKKYGLLGLNPDCASASLSELGVTVEPLMYWKRNVGIVDALLHTWLYIRPARDGHPARLRELWPLLYSELSGDEVAAPDDTGNLITRAESTLSAAIAQRVGVVPTTFDFDVGLESFVFEWQPTTLLQTIYLDMALLITSGVELRTCQQCGRPFVVHDKRQRFCNDVCANRARYQRRAQRERETAAAIDGEGEAV